MKQVTNVKAMVFEQKVILGLSMPLIALLVYCSTRGLLYLGIYTASAPDRITQMIVLDGIHLFIVCPLLTVAALYSFQGIKFAHLMWGGTVSYLVYTFLIYFSSVGIHELFLIHCIILGLSVLSLAWFLLTTIRHMIVTTIPNHLLARLIGVYFIITAISFYLLWWMEIHPASTIQTTQVSPPSIDHLANPIQPIGLSIFSLAELSQA